MNQIEKSKLKKSIIIKTFLVLIALVLLFFIVIVLFSIISNRGLSFKSFNSFFKQIPIVIQNNKKYFYLVYCVLGVLTIFVFFIKELKILAKTIKSRLFENTSGQKNWLFNANTKDGSKKALNLQFLNLLNETSSANWIFGFDKKGQKWYVNNTDDNAIIYGSPGSGKTQRLIIPNILYFSYLEEKPNLVVVDPKKEILKFTGKYLENANYQIFVIDFKNPDNSLSWNPLSLAYDSVHNNKFANFDEKIGIAYKIINNTVNALDWNSNSSSNSKMWELQAKNAITIIAKFLLLISIENKNYCSKTQFNFETIASFLTISKWSANKNNPKWIKYVKSKAEEKNYYWCELFDEIQALGSSAKETLTGIFVEASARLKIFQNDEILKPMLRKSKIFDLAEFFSQDVPFAIFISYPDYEPSHHFLVSMLIENIYQAAIENASKQSNLKLKHKLFVFCEEFGNTPRIPNFDNKLTIARSRNIFFEIVLQSQDQLKKYNDYGNNADKIIKDGCQITLFLSSKNRETLKDISEALGTYEKTKMSYSTSTSGSSSTETTQEKAIMEIADLQSKQKDELIVIKEGSKPILIKTFLAFKCFENSDYVYTSPEKTNSLRYERFDLDKFIDLVEIDQIHRLEKESKTLNSNSKVETKQVLKKETPKNPKAKYENAEVDKYLAFKKIYVVKEKIPNWLDLTKSWHVIKTSLKGSASYEEANKNFDKQLNEALKTFETKRLDTLFRFQLEQNAKAKKINNYKNLNDYELLKHIDLNSNAKENTKTSPQRNI